MEKLLTTNEAADILGVTVETLGLWRCTKRYQLPYTKIGSRVMYRKEDLLAFIESRTVTNPGGADAVQTTG